MDLQAANEQIRFMELLSNAHPELVDSGFAHVANVGELKTGTVTLAPGLDIRKATPNEMSTLHHLVPIMCPTNWFDPDDENPYEVVTEHHEVAPGQHGITRTALDPDEWRYHVIEFKGSSDQVYKFAKASVLTENRLALGPVLASAGAGLSIEATGELVRIWNEHRRGRASLLVLDSAAIEDLRLVFEKLDAMRHDIANLKDAMQRFSQLDSIPEHSLMRFLGYVSVLESLITHPPKHSDPYDSLTRQVRQKMLLLGSRSKLRIPYEVLDDHANPSTLWTKIYSYRSDVAHGGARFY